MHEFFLSAHYTIIVLFIAIATEAVIELVKESDISLRFIHPLITSRFQNNATWYNYTMYKWITCGQCMSVIYSVPGAIYLSAQFPWQYYLIAFPAFLFVLQRITNWLNTAYKLLLRGRITAIDFITPLIKIEPDMSHDRESLLSNTRDKEFKQDNEEKVSIRSVQDIVRIIELLKSRKPGSGNIVSVNIGQNQFNVNTSTNHPPYMDMIKDAINDLSRGAPVSTIEINNGERITALPLGTNHIIDEFIVRCAGGLRDGGRIKWALTDGDYFYDPMADKLTKVCRPSSDN